MFLNYVIMAMKNGFLIQSLELKQPETFESS